MQQKADPPVVIKEDCVACQRCVATCPSFVLEMLEAKAAVVRGDWCIGCQHCGAVCPTAAIRHDGSVLDSHPSKGEAPATPPEILELLLCERRSVRLYTGDPVPSFNCSVALYNCPLMAHTLGPGCCFNGFLINALNHSSTIKHWLGIRGGS
ncbi:MAG TPA: 4Fe-4S dicluster domain-containing protein [Thermodesulfobacteriota bacterium]|nr:4Fe-4S dicluster domain-containing protein [Thermodesulfobacteriota bacterium]